ncbi:MAG: IMP dehydrogenase [Candidatus Terraquivivens tikiterensis]|uniref:Inosine-5'-monophosphate dehydrogenase n=1 Tax=Candidatus Terraquivivens tikiterensis TaxID=1980982 RepID=A0A2R7Y2U7_9ARCH|nr:MAG: IMP dehydrogenase [Candidatus Terraquivivens tikiterensis]
MVVKNIEKGLTFDDVLLVPQRSSVHSRKEVSTESFFTKGIQLNIPIVSSAMDTVTEAEMAITMARHGGIGVVHRFMPIEKQAQEVQRVKRAENIIIERPYTLPLKSTVGRARALMEEYGVGGLLVVDEDGKLRGLVTKRDILFEENNDRPITEVMTPRERLVVSSGRITLEEAREIFKKHKVEKLPLVDEEDRVVGLVTAKDIMIKSMYPNAARDRKGRLLVAAAIGIKEGYLERAKALLDAGADALVVDVAHGHTDEVIRVVRKLKETFGDVQVVAGNVATPEGFEDLASAGADAVKVGIGPGAVCTTRIVAGVGVPQLTAILNCAEKSFDLGVPMIADGGIRNSGDLVKALAAGASTVMLGSLLAGTDESPGTTISRGGRKYKVYRGMASFYAMLAREVKEGKQVELDSVADYAYTSEGVEAYVPYRGSASELLKQLVAALRAGMSYCGARNIRELWDKAKFISISEAGIKESYPHDVEVIE